MDYIAFHTAVVSTSQFPIPCFLVQRHVAWVAAATHLPATHLS
jgi:hypothetical protein